MAPVRCNEWVTVESTGFTYLFNFKKFIVICLICIVSYTTQYLMSFVEDDNIKPQEEINIFNLLQRNKQRTEFLMLQEN